MEKFWLKIAEERDHLIKSWSWGMIYGFFYEHSLYDAKNLFKFIESYFNYRTVQRHLNIGLANVLNGQYKSFEDFEKEEKLVKVLQASMVYPGVFKSVEAFDQLWVTGAAIYEIDVMAPILHCRELGFNDTQINVDVILSGKPKL